MKRTLLALTLFGGLFVFSGAASATLDILGFDSAVDAMLAADPTLDPPPNDPSKDFAVGGLQVVGNQVAISAHSEGPRAEDAWGHVSATFASGAKGRWRVVCLAVLGKKAAIGVEPQESASNDLGPFIFLVRDSGLPGGTGDFFAGVGAGSNPELCQNFLIGEPTSPIERGNILVHDASLP